MKTPNKKSETPARKISTALLGEEVAKNWDLQFRHLQISNFNASTMQAEATQLRNLLTSSNDNSNELKRNTADLQALNKLINTALSTLKSHIKIIAWQSNILQSEYAKYGLLKIGASYKFPVDNSFRQVALQTLISKLQEANNPIANQAQGLNFWTDLQTRHAALWNNSNQLRSNTSQLAQQTDVLTEKVRNDLKRVKKMLEIEYTGADLKRQKRTIGFLKESL